MTVTLTYDDTLSRVVITATGLAAATSAVVERSTNQINWTTVRGASAAPAAAGALTVPVYDYEFAPNVVNYYRVRGVSSAPIAFVSTTATVSDANATGSVTLAPTLPASLVEGDVIFIEASIRNSGVGTVNTPTGWTKIAQTGNVALLARRYTTGVVMPTVTFAAGVANATIIAKAYAFRDVDLTPSTTAGQLNGAGQDIAFPAAVVPDDDSLILISGWKQSTLTSVAQLGGFTELLDISVSAGDDASMVIDYRVQSSAVDVTAGTFTVTGAVSAISRGLVVVLPHAPYLNEQTATITPDLTSVWLKSVSRPFLNQPVTVLFGSSVPVTRPARVGVFDIVSRTLPIAVSDVRTSRRWTMRLYTETAEDSDKLDLILASGDVLYMQAPAACVDVLTAFIAVDDITYEHHPLRPLKRRWTLPVTEVAAPGPDVVGSTVTWATVLATYGTWADVMAAHATWASLLTLIGDPSEVIVP